MIIFLFYKIYSEIDLLQIAAEIADPLSKVNKIVMVSNSGEVGAAKMTGEVMDIITKIQGTVSSIANSSAGSSTVGTLHQV